MRILVLPVGSHGDVHPLLGIAMALRRRGHDVTVATNEHFEPLIRAAHIPFLPTGTDAEFRQTLSDPALWHPLKGFKTVMEKGVLTVMRRTYDLIRSNFSPDDTVILAAGIAFGARVAQDKHGYRVATVQLQPAAFRSVYANPKLPGMFMPQGMPRFLKRAIWSFADFAVIDPILRKPMNEFRRELGLTPIRHVLRDWWNSPLLTLGLFPEWFAPPQPDWPKQLKLVGFPLFDEQGITPLPPDLLAFLSTHPKPIAFTPGSANTHGREFFAESVSAVTHLNRPALLLTRHPEQIPQNLPANILHVPYAPFSQLLPHCAALVHHGGIGTTAQALAAACPQLIMPFSHDQPDNAARVQRLGVGATIPRRQYRAPNIAGKLRALLNSSATLSNCQSIAARFQNTRPLAAACDHIESLAARAPLPRN